MFFFEKKNQKTFIHQGPAQTDKCLFVSYFLEKKTLPYSAAFTTSKYRFASPFWFS